MNIAKMALGLAMIGLALNVKTDFGAIVFVEGMILANTSLFALMQKKSISHL